MADSDLTIKIKGDSKNFEKSLGDSGKAVGKFNINLKKLSVAGAAAFAGIAAAATFAVKKAADFEVIQTQFEVLTGNVNDAKFAMEELAAFSAKTPFQFEDIAKASQKLLGFGFSIDELNDKMKQVGDVSAAVGADLGELTLIYGQIQSQSKLTGERFQQLQERAIPIGPALAKTMGVAESEIRKLISAGEVTNEVFQKAFATLSEEGGVAFNGMQKRSETLSGKISTLMDNFVLLAVTIGNKLLPVAKPVIDFLTDSAQKITKFLKPETETEELTGKIDTITKKIKDSAQELKAIEDREGSFLNLFAPDPEKVRERMEELEAQRQELVSEREEKIAEEDAIKAETQERRAAEAQARLKKAKENERKIQKENEQKVSMDFMTELNRRQKWDEINGQQKIKNLQSTLGQISSLSEANNKGLAVVGKASAIALATMNTFQAANVALASAPPPFNFGLAAAVVTAGLANVAKIVGVQLAEGGIVMPSPGGTQATIGEAGSPEAVIPLDSPEANEFLGPGTAGEPMEININFTGDLAKLVEEQQVENEKLRVSIKAA